MIQAQIQDKTPYDIHDAKAFLNLAIQAACDVGIPPAMVDQLMETLRYLETLPPAAADWLELD